MKTYRSACFGTASRLCAIPALVFGSLILSACAADDVAVHGPEPVISRSMSSGDVVLPPHGSPWRSHVPLAAPPDVGVLVLNFENAANAAATDPADPDKPTASERRALVRFAKSGVTLVNARCAIYFDIIGRRSRDMSLAADELTLLTTSLTTILAKSLDADTIASGAAVGSFLSTSTRNARDAFFYSDDVGNVQKLVVDAAAKAAAQIDNKDAVLTYEGVIDFLASYDAVCQPQTIHHLIVAALAKAKPQVTGQEAGNKPETPKPQETKPAAAASAGHTIPAKPQLGAFTIGY